MRISSFNLFVLLTITTLTAALPFFPKPRSDRPLARRTSTYSVVPVDGGSTGVQATTTVTESASPQLPVTETRLSTLLSTKVVTAYETPSTLVVTITATPSPPSSILASTEATSSSSYSESTTTTTTTSPTTQVTTVFSSLVSATAEFTTSITTVTSAATPAAVVNATTLVPQVVTVTALPLSTPYDDGMWHTTYYHPVYETSLLSPSSYSATSTIST